MINMEHALIIPAAPGDWKAAVRCANLLLKAGLPVAWSTQGFYAVTDGWPDGHRYPAGSFIAPLEGAAWEWAAERAWLAETAQDYGAEAHTAQLPIATEVFWLRPAAVALFADAGTPYPFADILGQLGFQNNFITSAEIQAGGLAGYDALIIPGGGWKGPAGQSQALGDAGRLALGRYLAGGGAVWGSCAGACNLILMPEAVIRGWADVFPDWPAVESCQVIGAEYWSAGMPGIGRLKVKNVNASHPVMSGMPEEFEIAWHLGPFLSLAEGASEATPLLQCVGFTERWTPAEHMTQTAGAGPAVAFADTYAARGIQAGMYGIVAGNYGRGKVAASGCHPEFGLDWLLERWDSPARILANFVLWAAAAEPARLEPPAEEWTCAGRHQRMAARQWTDGWTSPDTQTVEALEGVMQSCRERLAAIRAGVADLRTQPLEPLPAWLSETKAEATFSLTAAEKWPRVLSRMAELCGEVEQLIGQVRETLEALSQTRRKLQVGGIAGQREGQRGLSRQAIAQWLIQQQRDDLVGDFTFASPVDWQPDYGRASLPQLLGSCQAALDVARSNFDQPDPPYHESPYIAVWGFYLGGLYDLMNAAALARNRIHLARDALRVADCPHVTF